MDWANSSMRVSDHSWWPKKYGELAPSASCGPASTCAAFQFLAKSPGDTCRCNCVLVQADSGAMDADCMLSGSGPAMSIWMSSPRALKIESLSATYRVDSLIQPPARCSGISVGRIPIITMWAPPALALVSAAFRLARTSSSSSSPVWPAQRPRWDVEFDVVGTQFGLVGRIGDGGQHLAVGHRRLVVGVDQVAFDFHAGERMVEFEAGLRQHRFEHVQAQLHLAPVLLPIDALVGGPLDVFAH